MICAARSAVCWRPMASTKSPSGSGFPLLSASFFCWFLRVGESERTHQVEVYGMVDQVIHPWLHALGGREVDAVGLADVFDLLPGSCEADDGGVEFGEVGF